MALHGLFNIAKPSGVSSRGVVDQVVTALGQTRVGHAGTLDPLASGVLVIAVGLATRAIDYVQRLPKRYRGTFLLGRTSPSEDLETEVTLLEHAAIPSRAELVAAAARFTGELMQRPSAFSAVKLNGKRAYKLARRGRTVEITERPVSIYRLDIVEYDYPSMTLDVACSGGTYIRALGRDLAESVGSGAVMSALERTAVGSFTLDSACPWEQVTPDLLPTWILPLARAVEALPCFTLTPEERERVSHGRPIPCRSDLDADEVACLEPTGALAAVLRRDGSVYRLANNFIPSGLVNRDRHESLRTTDAPP